MTVKARSALKDILRFVRLLAAIGLLAAFALFVNNLFASRASQTASQPQGHTPPSLSIPDTTFSNQTETTVGWKVYRNEYDRYEIMYPPEWFLYPATAVGNGTDLTDSDISEYKLVPSPDDPEHVRLNIIAFRTGQQPDLETWLRSYDRERVFSESPVAIAGISGVFRIETNSEFKQLKPIERAITIYLPWKEVVFRVTVFPTNSVYLDTVNTILQSFKPLK